MPKLMYHFRSINWSVYAFRKGKCLQVRVRGAVGFLCSVSNLDELWQNNSFRGKWFMARGRSWKWFSKSFLEYISIWNNVRAAPMRRKTDGINQDPNGVVSPKENAWEMYLLIFWTIEPLCQLLHTGNDTKNICLHRIVTDTFLVYLYPFLLYHTWNKWNVLPWRVLRPPNNGTNSQGRIKGSPFSWVICRIVVPSEFMSFLFVLFLLTCCFM